MIDRCPQCRGWNLEPIVFMEVKPEDVRTDDLEEIPVFLCRDCGICIIPKTRTEVDCLNRLARDERRRAHGTDSTLD